VANDTIAVLEDAVVRRLQRHSDEGRDRADLATIMEPFAPCVVFGSPFVPRLTGDPNRTTIAGHEALRAYVEYTLARTPGIRYRWTPPMWVSTRCCSPAPATTRTEHSAAAVTRCA
jgi:hypothetical protein